MQTAPPSESSQPPVGNLTDAWTQILAALQPHVDNQNYITWLKPTNYELLEGKRLFVRVPHATFRDWIEAHYQQLIRETIAELNLAIEAVDWVVGDQELSRPQAAFAGASAAAAAGGAAPAVSPAPGAHEPLSSPLIGRYTFASFVVGSSNQFAHAAATRVAADPGRSFNPLFIYGGSGLGKTHLMQAIGHELRARYSRWRVVYLSAERFTNEMVQSLKNLTMPDFHQRFRSVDALLVDDIQFLSGKEMTQEEFFHTFNTLYERQAQIVISSDRVPKDIDLIEERLRSRFEWGLIADIQPPDLETRQAILMKKAEGEQFRLPEEVALLIATNVKSNIRELEGSLIRLIAYASLTGEEITPAMARQVLKELIDSDPKRITIEAIQKTVCSHYGLRLSELKAKDNSKRVVVPRQVAMWLARELTRASLPEIARAFGDKHHTTVLHSISKINSQRLADKDLNKTLNKLLSNFE